MKFIADSMLGRLARWLRLLGHDTLYFPHIEDGLLLKKAREEDRTLLTRDTRLVKRRGLKNFLLLKENDTFDQLRTVITAFNLLPFGESGRVREYSPSRCSLCNDTLISLSREEARAHVPDYVYRTSDVFRRCMKCGRFYWEGTHPGKWRKKLSETLGCMNGREGLP